MKKMKKLLRMLSSCLLATALFLNPAILGGPICKASEPADTISIGITGDVKPLAPNDWRDVNTAIVVRTIYEHLIFADKSMNFHPGLATSWNITPDGNLLFNLRKGVKFHDDSPFDANAVKVTFDRIKNEKLIHRQLFDSITSVETIDPFIVKMNLKGSPASVLANLAIYGLIESPAAIQKYGSKEIGLHPIGTGPYKFVEWVPDQRIVLEANNNYWGGKPRIAKVIFKPVPEPQSRVAMIQAGNLDVSLAVPLTEIERLRSLPNLTVKEEITGNLFFLIFNTAIEPFNDKRIRQAIAYGIDRNGIVKSLLFGRLPVANSYAAPDVKHVLKYDIYPYNPEKAKNILAESGWKLGKSGFLEKSEKVLRAGLITTSGREPMDRQIAEAIQAQLKKIGVDLKVIVLESATFEKAVFGDLEAKKKAEFGMLLRTLPMGPDADSAFNMRFHSSCIPPNGTNAACFVNSELDRALELGAKETDEAKRAAAYKKVQDILNEEVPWLPIYSFIEFIAHKKGIDGVGSPNPFYRFKVSKETRIER